MLNRIIYAVAIGVIVFLGCTLLGAILLEIPVSWAAAVGAFFRTYASLLGLLAALLAFATNRNMGSLL